MCQGGTPANVESEGATDVEALSESSTEAAVAGPPAMIEPRAGRDRSRSRGHVLAPSPNPCTRPVCRMHLNGQPLSEYLLATPDGASSCCPTMSALCLTGTLISPSKRPHSDIMNTRGPAAWSSMHRERVVRYVSFLYYMPSSLEGLISMPCVSQAVGIRGRG